MRQNDKYLAKVFDELDVYRSHLLLDTPLSPQQQETFEKIDIARAYLKDGYSDSQVIKMLKNDPSVKTMDRRSREILALAYEIFAELRQTRNSKGVKMMYAEQYREAAAMILEEAKSNLYDGDKELAVSLFKEYKSMLKEAAIIDGAYLPEGKNIDDKKKPTKIEIKRVTINNYADNAQETAYELLGENTVDNG